MNDKWEKSEAREIKKSFQTGYKARVGNQTPSVWLQKFTSFLLHPADKIKLLLSHTSKRWLSSAFQHQRDFGHHPCSIAWEFPGNTTVYLNSLSTAPSSPPSTLRMALFGHSWWHHLKEDDGQRRRAWEARCTVSGAALSSHRTLSTQGCTLSVPSWPPRALHGDPPTPAPCAAWDPFTDAHPGLPSRHTAPAVSSDATSSSPWPLGSPRLQRAHTREVTEPQALKAFTKFFPSCFPVTFERSFCCPSTCNNLFLLVNQHLNEKTKGLSLFQIIYAQYF